MVSVKLPLSQHHLQPLTTSLYEHHISMKVHVVIFIQFNLASNRYLTQFPFHPPVCSINTVTTSMFSHLAHLTQTNKMADFPQFPTPFCWQKKRTVAIGACQSMFFSQFARLLRRSLPTLSSFSSSSSTFFGYLLLFGRKTHISGQNFPL